MSSEIFQSYKPSLINPQTTIKTKFRVDIQALRGFAVLIVVLYHAGLAPFHKAGYLGVDIFFVISGYLITGLIANDIQQSRFSFIDFYFRRAKRLLPALYTVLLLTIVGSILFMTLGQYRDYKNALLGTLSFTANFALYDQTGYFSEDAKFKPLLHMWSLAIEEQFYMFLPLALFFMPQKTWKISLISICSLSLIWCLTRVSAHPESTFYFLPGRAWELMLGSIAALYRPTSKSKGIYNFLFYPSIITMLALSIFPISINDPGFGTLLICICTAIVIQRNSSEYQDNKTPFFSFITLQLSRIGNISYPLYLIHWPLFSFAANTIVSGQLPFWVRIILMLVSFPLAFLLYRFIENPIHRAHFSSKRRFVISLLAASLALAGLSVAAKQFYMTNPAYHSRSTPNLGINPICDQKEGFQKLTTCETTSNPKVLIWGDSYAMQWIVGLQKERPDISVAQATRRACSPLTTLSYQTPPKHSHLWAQNCIDFNQKVLATLPTYKSVDTVVLSSMFEGVTNPTLDGAALKNGKYNVTKMGSDAAIHAMRDTVNQIRATGKKVVVLSPPVKNNFDVGSCLEKLKLQKISFGSEADCRLSLSRAKSDYADLWNFLDRLPKEANVNVVKLSDYLCKEDTCKTSINNTILYSDIGHISQAGAIAVATDIHLMELLINAAY